MQVIHEAEDLSISGFQARVFLEERIPCHCNATAEQPFLITLPPVCFDLGSAENNTGILQLSGLFQGHQPFLTLSLLNRCLL